MIEGEPKTHRSRRSVALSPSAVALLRSVRQEQRERRMLLGPMWEGGDLEEAYLFTKPNGVPLDPDWLGRDFTKLVRKAALPQGTLHTLRHSFATALLTAGIHPAVTQAALGHSSISVTIDTYSHVLKGLKEEARTIDQALGEWVS